MRDGAPLFRLRLRLAAFGMTGLATTLIGIAILPTSTLGYVDDIVSQLRSKCHFRLGSGASAPPRPHAFVAEVPQVPATITDGGQHIRNRIALEGVLSRSRAHDLGKLGYTNVDTIPANGADIPLRTSPAPVFVLTPSANVSLQYTHVPAPAPGDVRNQEIMMRRQGAVHV